MPPSEPTPDAQTTPPGAASVLGPTPRAEDGEAVSHHPTRRFVLTVLLRAFAISSAVLLVYFLLPVSADGAAGGGVILAIGLVLLTAAVVRQIQKILVADHPVARGVEAIAMILPLFVVLFAYGYVWLTASDPAAFSQPINRVDGLYFVMTVLSTVGFGDITPVSQNARIVVTVQMLLGVILIGVVAKLIIGASQIGVQRVRARAVAPKTDGPADASPDRSA